MKQPTHKMKKLVYFFLIISFSVTTAAQENCLDPDNLLKLDAQWEKALLDSDDTMIRSLLADDFVWIHNHASFIDSKTSLLKSASNPKIGATGNTTSRKSQGVKVLILESTGIVYGNTIVERDSKLTNYHFMRTYVQVEGKCLLMANHTMAIPEEDD